MSTKEEKKAAKKARGKNLWNDFKKFVSKGNVLDMAVGVIMGSAFSAIVTAFTNILLSVCTWGVPGGLKGLVTVLPALNDAQRGIDGIGQKFAAGDLQSLATKVAEGNYATQIAENPNYLTENPNLIESAKTFLTSKYTLHGSVYTYNLSAVIDWGTLINAAISFLIIALTLFTIVKIAQWSAKKRQEFNDRMKEEYYLRHPEERPVVAAPAAPAPTETELLTQILAEMKTANAAKDDKKAE